LVRFGGLPADRTSVVPIALNYPYRPMDQPDASLHLDRLGLADARPFLLHVGGNSWHKNRVGVLRIFKEIVSAPERAGLRLVIAGKPWTSSMHDYVRQAGMEERVVELANVSNEELRALYSAAEALLFPSLYEGFGWPIIEAQACGCPVFTSDRLPMTEVAGRGAVYFDPTDELGAARIVAAHLADLGGIRILGAENAKRFSRDAMLAGYLEAYRKVAAEPTDRHASDSSPEAKTDRKSWHAE
jgi:glycosyltransferase involved in cell wall biosynthesis